MRGRLYLPNQHHESHHKICNLRYGTHGYGMSAYEITAKFKRFNALWFAGYKGRTLGVASLGSATRILDWRIFIDTTTSMLYTKPTSRSQTNNSYDYEAFIIVIILTTFLSADPKPDIRSRIWSQNSVPVRQEIPFWWKFNAGSILSDWYFCIPTYVKTTENPPYALKNTTHSIIIKGEYDWTQTMRKSNGILHFYKADTETVDFIPAAELTITFVCYHYPRTMLQKLQRDRQITVEKRSCVRTGRN